MGVRRVRLLLAQVPLHAGTAQHGAREAQVDGPLGGHHCDAHGALLPDAVVGKQGFVFIHPGGETFGEVLDEVEQRAVAALVQGRVPATVAACGGQVRGHGLGQVPVNATGAVVGGVHAGSGNRFVTVHEVLALAKTVQEYRHCPNIQPMAAQPQKMVEDPRDLIEHHADVAGAYRGLDAQKLLDGGNIAIRPLSIPTTAAIYKP